MEVHIPVQWLIYLGIFGLGVAVGAFGLLAVTVMNFRWPG